MNDRLRLVALAKPYWPMLLGSVLLMACVGAAHSMQGLLIGPIFDHVLNPLANDTRILLFTVPIFKNTVYLNDIVPPSIQDVWSMVAFAIVMVFLVKGVCDYFGNYLVNYVGVSAVTDLRNRVGQRLVGCQDGLATIPEQKR